MLIPSVNRNNFNDCAVSVVIPVYNTEKYIGATLESILNQTFQDFEVVITDDCSTDKSYEIAENYISKFNGRLKLSRTKKNSGGPGVPLNQGLELAKGKYIFFMDNDDLIGNNMLEELYKLGENFDADVVYMDKGFMFETNPSNPFPQQSELSLRGWQQGRIVEKPELETENLPERVQKFCRTEFGWPEWEKFVRRDFLLKNKIVFPEINSSGDVAWSMLIYLLAKKIVRAPQPFYYYRQHPTSVMHKERTTEETINFWLTINAKGLAFVEKFLSTQEFFQKNPQYKWELLKFFDGVNFALVANIFASLPETELFKVNEIIKPSFAKIFGEHGNINSYIFTQLNNFRAKFLVANQKAAELENQLKSREFSFSANH